MRRLLCMLLGHRPGWRFDGRWLVPGCTRCGYRYRQVTWAAAAHWYRLRKRGLA